MPTMFHDLPECRVHHKEIMTFQCMVKHQGEEVL